MAEGRLSKKEIIRYLKRYLAVEVYPYPYPYLRTRG